MKDDINNAEVGNRIKRIRTEIGLTTEKFGDLFDPPASKGTVSKWENGHYLPNNERLVIIAREGKVSVEELLFGDYKARINNILFNDLDEANKLFVTGVIEYFEETDNKYPPVKDVISKYYEIYDQADKVVGKVTSKAVLGNDLQLATKLLTTFISMIEEANVPPHLIEFSKIIKQKVVSALDKYEVYFDQSPEEALQELQNYSDEAMEKINRKD